MLEKRKSSFSLMSQYQHLSNNTERGLRGYNDMLYLIEKYAPLAGLDKYNPEMEE